MLNVFFDQLGHQAVECSSSRRQLLHDLVTSHVVSSGCPLDHTPGPLELPDEAIEPVEEAFLMLRNV